MDATQYVAAVDLGTTKVVMAVGRKVEKNKIEIVALKEVPSEGVIKGDLRNIDQAASSIREVKNLIEAELGTTIQQVYVGISGQHIQCTNASGYVFVQSSDQGFSDVTQGDVDNLNRQMYRTSVEVGKTIISVLPQTYRVDEEGGISQPVGMEGKRLEAKFNIIVGDEAAIERIRRCFNRAGLEMLKPLLQPLVSADAVLSEDEKELGVAVIDIGGGTTDLCIYHDKIIKHLAVIPIGGNIINEDIKTYGILGRHVEKLKVSFGEAVASRTPVEKYIKIPALNDISKEIPVRKLAQIIEARMYDIIEYVKHEIEKGAGNIRLGAGIVLTGGGAQLKNIDLLFKSKLDMEVRIAAPGQGLTAECVEGLKLSDPKYSTLVGIILDTLKKSAYAAQSEEPRPVAPAAPAGDSNGLYTETGAGETTVGLNPNTSSPYDYYPPQDNGANIAPAQVGEQYEEDGEDYYPPYEEEEPPVIVDRRPKRSLKDRFSKLIKGMMTDDEIDADDNY